MVSRVTKFFLNMIVEPQVRTFCGPLFFTSSDATPKDNIESSGSFGLVSIGEKKLLVTCWHVLYGIWRTHQELNLQPSDPKSSVRWTKDEPGFTLRSRVLRGTHVMAAPGLGVRSPLDARISASRRASQ